MGPTCRNARGAGLAAVAGAALLCAGGARAEVIGRMTPAEPLTEIRLGNLPAAQQAVWRAYLGRSEAAARLDATALLQEGGDGAPPPPAGNAAASMPLDRKPAWYAGPEARRIADVIVSFQTPAGGWGKNELRDGPARRPGQPFTGNAGYVGTLDNGATVTELRFLARVIANAPPDASATHRRSFIRGVRYLLAAQYPNGGWPQVWPLVGGYHDAVTFNDNAMLAATRLLGEVGVGRGDYAFTPLDLRRDAQAAWRGALACILAAQVVVEGRPAGWPQQGDAVTLQPVGARRFEPRALASAESAEILLYLMSLSDRSPGIVRAVHGGAGWLRRAALRDKAWAAPDAERGRRLVDQPGAPPLWARFYDIETGRPIFGDRDGSIRDDVRDLPPERRNGYAWFTTGPAKVLVAYERWASHPEDRGALPPSYLGPPESSRR